MSRFNTGNPLGSDNVKDLSDNAKNLDIAENTLVDETWKDRFGRFRKTWFGIERSADAKLIEIEERANRVIASLGFLVPVDYAPGLMVETANFTVIHGGFVYAVQAGSIPFTTGAWDESQWYPIQNRNSNNNLLIFSSIVEAEEAAKILPDGQILKSPNEDGKISIFEVRSGNLVFVNYLPTIISMGTYDELRSYSGPSGIVDVTSVGIAGRFIYDAISSDNDDGGLVIVGNDGRRWIRSGAAVMASVSPEIFGAAADGIADDSEYLQKAINSKRTVILAKKYRITRSIVINGQYIIGRGVTVNSGTWAMTTIIADGNFPAFIPASDSPVSADISGLFIWYADTTPLSESGNDKKTGFSFLNADFPSPTIANPQFTKISNCLIKGGWRAYDASGGAYLFKLERVWSWSCRFGFRHFGGTTLSMDTCYALFGEQAYFIQGVANVSIQNCAMDQMVVTNTTPQRAAAVFANIPGLNINGFYTELNQVKVDAGSLVMFIECVGEANAITAWRESLEAVSGNEVYGYRFYGGKMSISGYAPQVSGEGIEFTGDGTVMGILSQEGAVVTVETSNMQPPVGGTPSLRYSAGAFTSGVIYSHASDFSGGIDMSTPITAGPGVSFSPLLSEFTITGEPIVTGKMRRSGSMVFVDIEINPNGGTVACVPGTSNIPNFPVSSVGRPVASIIRGDFTGSHGYMNGAMLVMPFLSTSSSSIFISVAYASF